MTPCITQLSLCFLGQRDLVIDFDAPDISSVGAPSYFDKSMIGSA
jgi:hypothetical protein